MYFRVDGLSLYDVFSVQCLNYRWEINNYSCFIILVCGIQRCESSVSSTFSGYPHQTYNQAKRIIRG